MTLEINHAEEQEARRQMDEIIARNKRCQTPDGKKMIYQAFELAMDAHKKARRKSGEPYIMHPLAVARIVAEDIGLGVKGVTAALLHDVVEDADYTVEDIQTIFGPKVASIVDGLTKLNIVDGLANMDNQTEIKSVQAENIKKLLLTMMEDIRVIYIKLADRLHNMRTIDSMPDHKKSKIVAETKFIYAPLAHRLGLYAIKSELEDLCFKCDNPAKYQEISDKLVKYRAENDRLITKFSLPISSKLIDLGYDFEPTGRVKSIYSIWKKTQTQHIPFEKVYDILALRIVFTPKPDISEKSQCMDIYSVITDIYKPNLERTRDWVSVPKVNGYESLHMTVMANGRKVKGRWLEIQIRSKQMHEKAERGIAAHTKYKGDDDDYPEDLNNLLKQVRESLINTELTSLEFLDDVKMNLYSSDIKIFTPKGEMVSMPKDATVLDFAFERHTDMGYKCIGAKVDNKLVSLSHVLTNGDQVEIITSEKQSPKYEWLNYVKTSKAKTRIKHAIKEERKSFIQNGEYKLEEMLKPKKLTINSKILKKIQSYYSIENRDDLYYSIGKGTIHLNNLHEILSSKAPNKWVRHLYLSFRDNKIKPATTAGNKNPTSVKLSDERQEEYQVATCCNPIPGDNVVGYRNEDSKLILHSRSCPIAIRLMSSQGDRIVSANWESHKVYSHLAKITISGFDQLGVVSKITGIISEGREINMRSIHFDSHDGIFEGTIYLYVHNTEDLNAVIEQLSAIKGIYSVTRQELNNKK